MSDQATADGDSPTPEDERRAEALKERIYVSFTTLAVCITLGRHPEETTVGLAAGTLLITVLGTLAAVFVADVMAHMVLHAALPTRAELRHLLYVSFGSLSVVVVPSLLLGLAALSLVSLAWALTAAAMVLNATLVIVAFVAVRRLRVRGRLKLLALVAIGVLGLGVIGLELLIH